MSKSLSANREIRWFSENPMPSIETWFKRNDLRLDQQPTRIDYYLDVRPEEDISIKIREGKTEIKKRVDRLFLPFSIKQCTGKMESWLKWSLNINGNGMPDLVLKKDDLPFVAVQKQRMLVKFEILSNDIIKKIGATFFPSEGCQVELTKIKIKEHLFYSFGFESNGSDVSVERNFFLIAEKVLAEIEDIQLADVDSFAYPCFINKVIGG